jgi:hypothetical protein
MTQWIFFLYRIMCIETIFSHNNNPRQEFQLYKEFIYFFLVFFPEQDIFYFTKQNLYKLCFYNISFFPDKFPTSIHRNSFGIITQLFFIVGFHFHYILLFFTNLQSVQTN